jgi:poly(3-hydroxybutyrate) depolymerase
MTGFSGGGILTYHMLLKRPGLIRTAVPVCANYFGHGEFQKSPLTPAESAVPVRIFRGEHDPLQENLLPSPPWLLGALAGASLGIGVVLWRRTRQWRWLIAVVTLAAIASVPIVLLPWDGLDPQTSAAVRHLTECGYTDVTVTTIDGMGHEPATDRVVGIFKQVLDAPSP